MTRRLLLIAIGLLYLFSIPWYRSSEAEVEIVLGLPDWVAFALLCYGVAAVLNAIAWWRTEVPETADSSEQSKDADS